MKYTIATILYLIFTYSCKTSKLPKLEEQASYIAESYVNDFFEHHSNRPDLGSKPMLVESTPSELLGSDGDKAKLHLISYHNLSSEAKENLNQKANELSCLDNGKELYNNYILPWQVTHTLSHRLFYGQKMDDLSYWEQESTINQAAIKLIAANGYYAMQKSCILPVSRLYVKTTEIESDPFFWEKEDITDYKKLAFFQSKNMMEAWEIVKTYKNAAKPKQIDNSY